VSNPLNLLLKIIAQQLGVAERINLRELNLNSTLKGCYNPSFALEQLEGRWNKFAINNRFDVNMRFIVDKRSINIVYQ